MIPTVIDTSEIVGDLQAEKMTLHLTPQLFRMISTSIYECRERAIIQELVANSLDACKSINSKAPIEITLPTAAAPQLTVLDHGIGMDADTLLNSALAYGNSTKALDNIAVGGFGIGLKSVFSITDSVTITTVKDGMKHVAVGMMVDGIPVHKLISSVPTDETSGTAVVIPAPEEYFQPLAEIARTSFRHWTHDVLVDGVAVNTSPIELSADNPLHISPKNYGWGHSVRVCIGGFMLEVSLAMSNVQLNKLTGWSGINNYLDVTVYADIGELEIAPSRERIEYTTANAEIIQNRIDTYAHKWIASLQRTRTRLFAFYQENYHLFKTEPTLEDLPEFQKQASRLRSICDFGTLEICLARHRISLNGASSHVLRALKQLYPLKGFAASINVTLVHKMVTNTVSSLLPANVTCSVFSKRGSRYASTEQALPTLVTKEIAARVGGTLSDTVLVVTDMSRSRYSRIFNQDGGSSIVIPTSTAPEGKSVLFTDIVLIDSRTEQKLSDIQDVLSRFSDTTLDVAGDSAFVSAWSNTVSSARSSGSRTKQSAGTSNRTDVSTSAVIFTSLMPEERRHYFDDNTYTVGFYETLEKFKPVCELTNRKRLLLVGTLDNIGVDTDIYSGELRVGEMRNTLQGSDIYKDVAEVVLLIAPSVSQVRSKRMTTLIDKIPEHLVHLPDCARDARNWVTQHVSEAHVRMMHGLALVTRRKDESADMMSIARQLPYPDMRRAFLKLNEDSQLWFIKHATNYCYSYYHSAIDTSKDITALTQVAGSIDTRWNRASGLDLNQRSLENILQALGGLPPIQTLIPLGLKPEALYREIRTGLRTLTEAKLKQLSNTQEAA